MALSPVPPSENQLALCLNFRPTEIGVSSFAMIKSFCLLTPGESSVGKEKGPVEGLYSEL